MIISTSQECRPGFTLIELLVVVAWRALATRNLGEVISVDQY